MFLANIENILGYCDCFVLVHNSAQLDETSLSNSYPTSLVIVARRQLSYIGFSTSYMEVSKERSEKFAINRRLLRAKRSWR
jgi:hypothetical protein